MATAAPNTQLPLLYNSLEPLNSNQHGKARVRRLDNARHHHPHPDKGEQVKGRVHRRIEHRGVRTPVADQVEQRLAEHTRCVERLA